MSDIKRYDELMEEACTNMIAKQDKITDFNEGSVIHTILDTFCRIIGRLYTAIRTGFNTGLLLLVYSLFNFKKKSGNYAGGKVTFSRTTPIDARSVIPAGVKVSGNGKTYITTESGVIESGMIDSSEVIIKAAEAGSDYNSAAGVVNSIDSSVPSDIVLVTNSLPITGGTDEESDADAEDRFTKMIAGLSGTNLYAIESAALSIDSVRSVSVKNHKPPLQNVYHVSVYVDDGTGNASNETLEAVRKAVEGDESDRKNGHLAPGITARYLVPTAVPVDFTISITTNKTDYSEVESEVKRIVQTYVNSLQIGKSVILSTIIKKILELSYIYDVSIKSPTENFDVNDEQIARYRSADITIIEAF